jgi:hypothetical protein
MPPVMAEVRLRLGHDADCAALSEEGVDPLVIMDAADLELILGTATASGRDFTELLDGWQESALAMLDFRSWATTAEGVTAVLPAWVVDAAKTYSGSAHTILFG